MGTRNAWVRRVTLSAAICSVVLFAAAKHGSATMIRNAAAPDEFSQLSSSRVEDSAPSKSTPSVKSDAHQGRVSGEHPNASANRHHRRGTGNNVPVASAVAAVSDSGNSLLLLVIALGSFAVSRMFSNRRTWQST